MTKLDADDAIHGLMGVTARMAGLVAWLVVAVAHLGLVLTLLVTAWLWRLTPAAVSRAAQSVIPESLESSMIGKLVFLGLPILAALWAYARVWRWLIGQGLLRYLLNIK